MLLQGSFCTASIAADNHAFTKCITIPKLFEEQNPVCTYQVPP